MPRHMEQLIKLMSRHEAAALQSAAVQCCYPLLGCSMLLCTGSSGQSVPRDTLNAQANAYFPSQHTNHNSTSTEIVSTGASPSAAAAASCSGASPSSEFHHAAHSHTFFSINPTLLQGSRRSPCNSRGGLTSGSRVAAVCRPFTTSTQQAQQAGGHQTADDLMLRINIAADLQQLHQLLAEASKANLLSAVHIAASYCKAVQLAAQQGTVAAVQPTLDLLQPAWLKAVQSATVRDLSDALFSWSKLIYTNAELWATTVTAVPAGCKHADGQDLSNIAYAIAAIAEANNGAVPGVSREEAQEVLRAVTHELVMIVQNTTAGRDDGRTASIANISTVRWAHETFEGLTQH